MVTLVGDDSCWRVGWSVTWAFDRLSTHLIADGVVLAHHQPSPIGFCVYGADATCVHDQHLQNL